MIIILSPDQQPTLTDIERLDRLHAECTGELTEMATGDLCRFGDDHVWLDVAIARSLGEQSSTDPEWPAKFDGMIGYAASKGWLDEAGTHVRAHVERV